MNHSTDVAIIGMACIFPQAPNLGAFWENILGKIDAVAEAPKDWGADLVYDPDSRTNDRIYTNRGGFLGELARFDPLEYGVMPKEVDGGEPEHFLALRVANDALRDAGCLDRAFPRERTSIILGRGTYVNRGFISMLQHCMVIDQTIRLLARLHPEHTAEELRALKAELKASLPPFNPETAPSLAHSVMCGRITNRLDLQGPTFTVDAACASSLIAVDLGIKELVNGGADLVVAGGVQVSTTFPISQLFCQLGALSRKGQLKPFDAEADGTLLGEGLGMVVLKRLADAQRDSDRVYAVVKSVGTASDGKAVGVLAPRAEGQELAMQRAYQREGITPDTIGLVEAHGTGTPVGDATEIDSLVRVFGSRKGEYPSCALGSVKSMIGHSIPAAGIAGIIKAALALHHKIIPPTLHCEKPNSRLKQTVFYLNTEVRPWIHGGPTPRRAAVSAFGFGGINAHAVLEEASDSAGMSVHARWDSEVVILAAESRRELVERAEQMRRVLAGNSDLTLPQLAYTFNCSIGSNATERLTVVCDSTAELDRKLDFALERLARPDTKRIRERSGIYYFESALGQEGKLAFLFPGEGAQYPDMLADLCLHFPQCRAWFDLIDRAFVDHKRGFLPSQIIFPKVGCDRAEREELERRLWDMDVAIESVFTANQALSSLLLDLGLKPAAVAGHSTGEYSALLVAEGVQVDSREHLIQCILEGNRITERSIRDGLVPERILLAVGPAHPARLRTVLENAGGSVYVAMDNCPNQAVICGGEEAIARIQRELRADGLICNPLPFRRPYHTPLFAPVCVALAEFFQRLKFVSPKIDIYSCGTASRFPDDPDEMRRIAVNQWGRPVRFRETIEAMYADGFRTFVEAGPHGNLTAFVEDILGPRKHIAIAANVPRRSGLTQLNHLVGFLAAHGIPLTLEPLYERRAKKLDRDAILRGAYKATMDRSMPLSLALPMLEVEQSRFSKADGFRLERELATTSNSPVRNPEVNVLSSPETRDKNLVMHEYLATMERFLESQQRVLDCYFAGVTEVPPPVSDFRPFIGSVVRDIPERAAVVLREFDLEEDLFLRQHALGPRLSDTDPNLLPLPIVPLAISVEMMAEAAALIVPGLRVSEIKDVRAFHWIALKSSRLSLEIEARLATTGANQVNVKIRDPNGGSQNGQPRRTFAEATVVFGERTPGPVAKYLRLQSERFSLWQPDELYAVGQRHGMFHGPIFQGVASLDRVGNNGAEATLHATSTTGMFRSKNSPAFLAAPLLLDAAGQVLGFWAADRLDRASIVFPSGFEDLEFYTAESLGADHVVCRVEVSDVNQEAIKANLDVVDASGQTLMRVLGWEAKRFDLPEHYYAFRLAPSQAFASLPSKKALQGLPNSERFECRRAEFRPGFMEADGGIWRECLAHLLLSARERETWRTLGKSEARRTDWLLGRLAAKDAIRLLIKKSLDMDLYPADIELDAENGGGPIVRIKTSAKVQPTPIVSIAHSDGTAVAIATVEGNCLGVGIDLEHDPKKEVGFEIAGFTEDERTLLAVCDPGSREQWLIRLWCAKEAASKAIGKGLIDGPGALLAQHLDPRTGAVKLRPSGALMDRFPEFRETLLFAYTEQDSDFIFATAIRERNGTI
jgi:acyl transferase domain-containing protein/phosphopantetheinyl transferase